MIGPFVMGRLPLADGLVLPPGLDAYGGRLGWAMSPSLLSEVVRQDERLRAYGLTRLCEDGAEGSGEDAG